MLKNRASWHKSCTDKISNEKLERLRKRKIEDSIEFIYSKYRRASLLKSTVSNCIFCNEPAGLDGLNNLKHLLDKPELDIEDYISWGAYHASKQMPFNNMKTTVSLMPLFLDCAHSIAMIKHSMNVISDTIQLLNPG